MRGVVILQGRSHAIRKESKMMNEKQDTRKAVVDQGERPPEGSSRRDFLILGGVGLVGPLPGSLVLSFKSSVHQLWCSIFSHRVTWTSLASFPPPAVSVTVATNSSPPSAVDVVNDELVAVEAGSATGAATVSILFKLLGAVLVVVAASQGLAPGLRPGDGSAAGTTGCRHSFRHRPVGRRPDGLLARRLERGDKPPAPGLGSRLGAVDRGRSSLVGLRC